MLCGGGFCDLVSGRFIDAVVIVAVSVRLKVECIGKAVRVCNR